MGQNDDMTIRAPDPGDSDRFNQTPKQEPQSSGFQDAPKFETPPVYSEPPRPTEVPSYGQVIEPPKKKNNKTLWIIIAIVVAVICCCCIVAIVAGNNFMNEFNIEDFDDLLNEFSQLIKLAPAFI
ncbi:MAG: hypothetical protein Q7U53_10170 [Anaerolineaceae bacterium]|nr:hypothetical protein [Anaerolineaceae bacterium]